MVANIRGYTPNYNFKLINFDTPRWHTLEYSNWTLLDSMLLVSGTPPIRGEWLNSTLYLVGDRVFDAQSSDIYRCTVQHTSAAIGTFSDERAAHPDYWTLQTSGVPVYRDAWASGVSYVLGDIIKYNSYVYYLCVVTHISGATFPPDAANWVLVFDATAAVADSQAAAAAAAASATAAAGSATSANSSATAAAASQTAANTSAINAAGSAATATTQAANAANSAAAAANSAASLVGTSATSNTITLGSKTFTTQAGKQFNVGNWMTIVDTAAPNTNYLGGQITAYNTSTGALTVNVVKTSGIGTINNWLLYVSGAVGADGAPGATTVFVGDAPPASAPDGTMWWESDTGLLYVMYNDGDTRQWVIAAPQPDTSAFLRTDASQSLTALQQQATRASIYAAPFDAMAYSGLQINGAMEVGQEYGGGGAGAIIPITNATYKYILDGWKLGSTGAQAISGNQYLTPNLTGFIKSLLAIVTTANTSPGAADYVTFIHLIEGYRVARLNWGTANAQPITIAFWVKANRPGNYSGSILNGAADRSYPFAFTLSTTDVWEYKIFTISGDTTGTWAKDNTTGMQVAVSMLCGSSLAATANAWTSGIKFGVPGGTNGVAATSDGMQLCGVTIFPGNEAPSAARSPFVMRSFADELMICRRYYQKTYDYLSLPGAITVGGALTWRNQMTESFGFAGLFYLTPEMRTVPTIAMFSPNSGNPGKIWNNVAGDVAGAVGGSPSTKFAYFNVAGVSIGTPPTYNIVHAAADARL